MKKFTSLLLALVMALSLAVPVFATNKDTDLGQGTKINSTINAATIKVTVPDTVQAVLNPYGIGYKVNKSWLAAETYNQSQIASSDNLIISQSNIPLEVQVNVVGTPTSGVTLEANSVASKKTKSVYMYVQFGTVDTGLVTAADIANTETGALKEAHANIAPPKYEANQTFTASEGKPLDTIVIKTTALTKPVSVGTLKEVPYSTGETPAPQTVSAIAYKLGGEMVVAPENNGVPNNWTSADKVEVNFTFTFIPKEAGVAADYTHASNIVVQSSSTSAETVIDLQTLLTTAANYSGDTAFTTKSADKNGTANTSTFEIANAKIDNQDAKKGTTDLVTLDSTDKKTVKIDGKTAFFDSGNPFSGRDKEIHYLTFDVEYEDVNEWTVTKTLKFPIEIKVVSGG